MITVIKKIKYKLLKTKNHETSIKQSVGNPYRKRNKISYNRIKRKGMHRFCQRKKKKFYRSRFMGYSTPQKKSFFKKICILTESIFINHLIQKIMKLQSNTRHNLLDSLTNNEIKNLTLQIRETVARGFTNQKRRIFSAADLWNIQRAKKNVSFRRNYF